MGQHRGRQDGWLQRRKLTVCEKSSSQVLYRPSISLLTRQESSGTAGATLYCLYSLTNTHRGPENTLKTDLWAITWAETKPWLSREIKMRRKYTSFPSFGRHHRLPCHESTTETDAIINYAGKRPLFSQGDGRPSATCSSCLWSSLASCRETFIPIWLPDGERHSTKNEYKSCHTDE